MEQRQKRTLTVTSSSSAATTAGAASTSTMKPSGGGGADLANKKVKVFYATEEQLRSVFSNALISDIILESFSFTDMKAAREVSRDFCKMIEGNKRFNETAVLHVTKEAFKYPNIISNWNRLWRGIKVDVSLSKEVWHSIPRHILQNVKFVSLVSHSKDFLGRKPAELFCLRKILDCTSNMEELELAVKGALSALPIDIFDVIAQRSASLKKLHLKSKELVDLDGDYRDVDWTFLGVMTQLKDFKLSRRFTNCDYDCEFQIFGFEECLLECLPRDQLERLSLRGISARNTDFWRRNESQDDYDEAGLPFKLELLQGFRNLKSLRVNRCHSNAVNDDVMRFISQEMTSLVELEFGHCSELTNAGIAGTSKDGSDSIRNIRGLKKLSIRHCPFVTPSGILPCLKFRFLRTFVFSNDKTKVSKSFVRQIVSQNASLESVVVNLDCPVSKALKEVDNPRLRKLINLCDNEDENDSDDSDADESSESGDTDDDDI